MAHWGCALQLPLPHRPTSAADQGTNEQWQQANHRDVQVCICHCWLNHMNHPHHIALILISLFTPALPLTPSSSLLPSSLHHHSPLPLSFSDGMGRTGAFICMHCELERLKVEGVVDIFHCIKASRISRPYLVQNVVSPTANHH